MSFFIILTLLSAGVFSSNGEMKHLLINVQSLIPNLKSNISNILFRKFDSFLK